jgi:hypothetical protein
MTRILSEETNESWVNYTDIENEIIEDAYRENKSQIEIDDDRIICLKDGVHFNKFDQQKQRLIKREAYQCDDTHLREYRFSVHYSRCGRSIPSSC